MNNKLLLFFLMLILTGCVNNEKISHVENDIHLINIKIDQLQQDIDALRQEIQVAKEAAENANTRLDDAGRWPDGIWAHPPRW